MSKSKLTSAERKAKAECAERVFRAVLRHEELPQPEAEYRFWPGRKFQFDYAWADRFLALEVEGGIYTGGAHGSVTGILRDIEKYSEAAARGWRILRVTPSALPTVATMDLIRRALMTADGGN